MYTKYQIPNIKQIFDRILNRYLEMWEYFLKLVNFLPHIMFPLVPCLSKVIVISTSKSLENEKISAHRPQFAK